MKNSQFIFALKNDKSSKHLFIDDLRAILLHITAGK